MKSLLLAATASLFPLWATAQTFEADAARAAELRKNANGKVTNQSLEVVWPEGESKIWYRRQLPGGGHEIILVDTESGKRELAFDHQKIAQHLKLDPRRIDVLALEAGEEPNTLALNIGKNGYLLDLETYELVDHPRRPDQPRTKSSRGKPRQHSGGTRFAGPDGRSPDKRLALEIRDHKLFLKEDGGEPTRLSSDGNPQFAFRSQGHWSGDSERVVVLKAREAQKHPVHMIDSAPDDQVQPKLFTHNYLKPGDQIAQQFPHLFDARERREIEVDRSLFDNPWSLRHLHWSPDGNEFRFVYNQRGHQVMRVIGIHRDTGAVRVIIDERSDTFIDYSQKHFVRFLPDSDEIIWSSERDGWHHLYLYEASSGKLKNQITSGNWVMRSVEQVDLEKRQITFRAMGIFPDQDPYHVHFARVDFDGNHLVHLTEGDGTHQLGRSPSGDFYVDTYSRVDLPPVHELRRWSDGKKICELERADTSAIAGWRPPQRFVAKGRDGKTDIHGIIVRPSNFDPDRSYPVIEKIYAGPHGHFVPKRFSTFHHAQTFAEHGFIVVQIDGMGTNFRSKAFHDVCWQNLMDSGFPDRIAWLRAAAAQHPELDLNRVGIFGGSAGGQSTLAGMLNHPDFYKVGVSDCGCHDNRMDKIWWNEAWMGTVGDHYAANSNVTHAHKLRGKLLLTVGELDRNVDPASTMQVVDALIKADRDFDMIVVPGAGHGVGESPYLAKRRLRYFIEHLK